LENILSLNRGDAEARRFVAEGWRAILPSTDGVVVRGDVQETLEVPYAKGGMPFHRYTPRIEFRYTVGGRPYTIEAPRFTLPTVSIRPPRSWFDCARRGRITPFVTIPATRATFVLGRSSLARWRFDFWSGF
jgi:hypothetical protein